MARRTSEVETLKEQDGVGVGIATVKATTDKAILVVLDDQDGYETWVPKSQIHDDSEVFGGEVRKGQLVVMRWFAESRGWA